MSDEMKVILYGQAKFKKLLKEVDPELRKEMDREIRSFLTPVSSLAKGHVPHRTLSGWSPEKERDGKWAKKAWDPIEVARGIKIVQGGRRNRGTAISAVWRITNQSAPGAIYELAGRKSTGKTPAGRTFIEQLTGRNGRPSRLIWRAWDEEGGQKALTHGVVKIINKYEQELDRRLSE